MQYLRRGAIALLLMIAGPGSTSAQPAPTEETSAHLAAATAIQAQTRARLGVLGDAFTCADARLVSFRRSDAEPETVEQWYVASQLWADAVLLEATPAVDGWDPLETRCEIDKGFVFLDRLWDFTSAGYFARANPVGTRVEAGPRYTDDNLVAGLALLAAARTVTDPQAARRYIHAAERQADFLLNLREAAVWDDTFGGGLWWRPHA